MTQQDAEALAARLARIWLAGTQEFQLKNEDHFSFNASFQGPKVGQRLAIHISRVEGQMFYRLSQYRAALFLSEGCKISDGAIADRKFQASFAAQWMDFFRRGCWLSGCDIEATAHEKAEWIRGFTNDEIEAWNLKL